MAAGGVEHRPRRPRRDLPDRQPGDPQRPLPRPHRARSRRASRRSPPTPEIRCIVLAGIRRGLRHRRRPGSLGAGGSELPHEATAAFWDRLAAIEHPIVAATSGWALGTGFELALACDMIVATKATRFGQPEVALGLIPGGGATQRLTRVIGKQRTMELILTGRRMGGEQALQVRPRQRPRRQAPLAPGRGRPRRRDRRARPDRRPPGEAGGPGRRARGPRRGPRHRARAARARRWRPRTASRASAPSSRAARRASRAASPRPQPVSTETSAATGASASRRRATRPPAAR